jgi:hypothetical protein
MDSEQPGPEPSPTERVPLLTPPTPWRLRQELEQALVNELLGPEKGEYEEVAEGRVQERYLVGVLAPKSQQVQPEELDRLETAEDGSGDGGNPEPTVPPTSTMMPSSIGLTFTVAGDVTAIQVRARWGWYQKGDSEHLTTETGKAKKVWKRTPVSGGPHVWTLREGELEPWSPSLDQPDVRVSGLARRNEGDWVVSIFLVNGQEEPEKNKDAAWLFQPELTVEGQDGSAIFRKRRRSSELRVASCELAQEDRPDGEMCGTAVRNSQLATRYSQLLEEEAMALLYRNHVEIASGHGVAVKVETAPGRPDRAVRVRTCVLPGYEVPRQTPPTPEDNPELAGLVLDMKLLAETPLDELTTQLQALPEAYERWIERQRELLGTPELAEHRAAGERALENCSQALGRIREGIELLGRDATAAEAFRFMNRAMRLQRLHSLYSEARRRDEDLTLEALDQPSNRTWYPFQLGFILLCLPGATDLHHPSAAARTRPSPTSCGSRPAAARARRTWGSRPTCSGCAACKALWPAARASTASRCSCATRCAS